MKNLLPVLVFAGLTVAGLFALGAYLEQAGQASAAPQLPVFASGAYPAPAALGPASAPTNPAAPDVFYPGTGPAPGAAFAPAPPQNIIAPAPIVAIDPSGAPAPRAGGIAAPPPATAPPPPGWGPPAAPLVDPRRFTEAHWQGLEVVPNTPPLARALNIDPAVQGVIVDDVTLPADLQGFVAGDVVTHVNGLPTPDLMSFIQASDRLRSDSSVNLTIVREGRGQTLRLTALLDRMGNANGETPSMIPPNARMPHAFRGPCVNCHRIGTTGSLMVDQGDPMPNRTSVPSIRAGAPRPHVDRGPCTTCHTVLP